ncbi:MAG: penicillin-binding transpeptidase domain-containing protein, partial [Methanothrix sp.]
MIILALLTLTVTGRLFQMSVLDHDLYLAKAQKQQLVDNDILPRRGALFAQDFSNGHTTTVAQSIESYSLSATPVNVLDKPEMATLLAGLTGKDQAKLLASFELESEYMNPIITGLSKADVERYAAGIQALQKQLYPKLAAPKISFDAVQGDVLYYLGGTFFIKGYRRVYPEGSLMGQALGFVDDTGQGRYGLEEQFNAELMGYAGTLRLTRDSKGSLLQQFELVKGENGNSFELTIDRNVQAQVEQLLATRVQESEAKGGSVVVMNPKNGEIIALASSPSYNPNTFRDLTSEQIGLFDNPVISLQWEPGSIFKPLIMAGAIDQGVVSPETKETFGASVTVDTHVINTALNKAYGLESMTDVLVNSDNVAMVWLGNKMGNQMIANYLTSYGFGHPTGIDLQNEISGSVLPVSEWRKINQATVTFGQGIAVTPM